MMRFFVRGQSRRKSRRFQPAGLDIGTSVEHLEKRAHCDVTIAWPFTGDMTAYKDDFCPYGHLSGASLACVILENQDHPELPPIQALSFYGDGIDLEFWTAQFGSVPEGTYTLSVLTTTDDWQRVGDLHF